LEADWLHREATFVLKDWAAADYGKDYSQLAPEEQARLRGRLQVMYRENGYDPASSAIRIDPVRARAFEACLAHFHPDPDQPSQAKDTV
jgi:nitric oxide reductase subunit B